MCKLSTTFFKGILEGGEDVKNNYLPHCVPSLLFSSIVCAPDSGSNIDHFILELWHSKAEHLHKIQI